MTSVSGPAGEEALVWPVEDDMSGAPADGGAPVATPTATTVSSPVVAALGKADPDPTREAASALAVTDELVDRLATRVIARLSDRVVREVTTSVVTEVAERLVREELERLKSRLR